MSFFVPLRPSPDWMRPTYIMEGNLLYSESINLRVNLKQIKNTLTEISRKFDQISEYYGPAKLTRIINHHIYEIEK